MIRTIAKDFRILSSLTILLSGILIGGTWAIIDYVSLKQESQTMHNRLLSNREIQLKERAQHAVNYINFFREQTEERLKTNIKSRTYEACEIAAELIKKHQGTIHPDTLHHIIRDSLRKIRYNNGRGYFFAINVNGTEELFADKPHLEGKNLTGMQDSNGQFVIKDMLALASMSGEGFYRYTWSKPGNDRKDNIKVAFVKHLPELDWVIGTGEYMEDVKQDLQQEVIDSLDAVYRDPDGTNYLFVGTWDGLILSRPAKGKNMLEIQDTNGLFIVRELIKQAKSGGGFVQYVMPRFEGERPAPKLSYVAGIPEWQWFIGAGEYIDNIDSAVLTLRDNYYRTLRNRLFYISTITLAVLLLNLIIINVFAGKLRNQMQRFVDFFHQAADQPVSIDITSLVHNEFRSIGSAANLMLHERNNALSELKDSNERFRQIFETNPDPVILAKLEGGLIIDVNKAFEALTGMSQIEAVGHNSLELGLWADEKMRESFLAQLHRDGELNNFEADFRVMDGHLRTGLLSARVVSINNEPSILIVIRDITVEKAAENTMIEMDRMKSEFISTAAHELSTPLSAMMGYTEFLIDPDEFGGFSEEQKYDFLNEIYDRGEALNRIIDDLLDISRIEAGHSITMDLQENDIRDVLIRSVEFFHSHKPEHSFRLDLPEEPGNWMILIDRHRVSQALENFLSNAVKYSPKNSEIVVECSLCPEGCEIKVEDQGIGMTPEQRDRVFDKFYRADASDTAIGGLGLGMNIARQIVESHGGKVLVESTEGKGTTVSFNLPYTTG